MLWHPVTAFLPQSGVTVIRLSELKAKAYDSGARIALI